LAKNHPLYTMIAKTPADMHAQAAQLRAGIARAKPNWEVTVSEEVSYLGGGSLPGAEMPSVAVRLRAPDLGADALALKFRRASVPIVARVANARVLLDMRTVFADELPDILEAVSCNR
jgi:L-seryl-tRNA(Ser) seleniumtransferase